MVEWKKIKGWEHYSVSNDGRIKNKHNRILSNNIIGTGYHQIKLWNDKDKKNLCVHKLVVEAFIDNPNKYTMANHIDRDLNNNNASNLRWCTRSENMQNKILYKNSTSGIRGVTWHSKCKYWNAAFRLNNCRYNKAFQAKEDAIQWRKDMESAFGYFNIDNQCLEMLE